MTTIIAKKSAINIIQSLPDDTTYDDILKELAFARMIEKGLSDSKKGKTVSNSKMREIIKQWQR